MPLNMKIHFRSGKTQLLENVDYTEKLRQQLDEKTRNGVIVDFEVF